VSSGVRSQALHRAAAVVGGKHRLRELLGVPLSQLDAWLEASEPAPLDIFLKAVDLIAEPLTPEPQRFLQQRFLPGETLTVARAAVEAAIGGTQAQRGNLQLLRPDGLRIVAHKGFDQPFLHFFACVHEESCVCGTAMKRGGRIVIPDVTAHRLFAGTRAGEILAEAGVRAVQSTPLLAPSGALLGMLSTHYSQSWEPSERELKVIDQVAQRAAFWLGGEL
jgi:hypothetical protein